MAFKPQKSLDTTRSTPCGSWCHRCGFARKSGWWGRGPERLTFNIVYCFCTSIRCFLLLGTMDARYGVRILEYLGAYHVVGHGLCLIPSKGAPGASGARLWVSSTWYVFCWPQAEKEPKKSSRSQVQSQKSFDNFCRSFHKLPSIKSNSLKIKSLTKYTMFPLFHAKPMFARHGMHGFVELDGFIRQPSACGAATVHSMQRISHDMEMRAQPTLP